MKLTKKLEAEIKRFMKKYWDTYLKGDLKKWATYIPDDYKNIGGTEEEIWNSKNEILDYTKRVINQMIGKAEIRNTKTQIFAYDPYIMVHEFTDFYVKADKKWTLYGKFRLSSIIQKKAGRWQVLHQHGSFPDSKAAEGEAFSIDQLRSENIKLQKAVKARTAELENKNRELEIEAALERVRAKAMAMQSSEELKEVAMELRHQMGQLGQKDLEVCAIHLYEVDPDFFESWGAMRPPGNEDKIYQGTARFPISGVKIVDEMMDLYRSGQKDYVIVNEKEKALEWFNVMKRYTPEAHAILMNSIKDIPKDKIIAYWSLSDFSGGSLLMVTHRYPDETSRNLLRRSANVFELAYRRFKDLKKSEEQSREANIELGLERVRSKAMAMHTSSELEAVAYELRTQMGLLGSKELETCAINLYEESEDKVIAWGAMRPPEKENEITGFNFSFPKNGIALIEEMLKAYSSGIEESLIILEGERMAQWLKVLEEARPDIFAIVDESIHYTETGYHKAWFSCAFFPGGTLIMITFSEPDIESRKLLTRFSQVFGLAYRRFADLKMAEAQAREAQIEAALERVRSRTMAMHKTSELQEVIHTVHKELLSLNLSIYGGSFVVINDDVGPELRCWGSGGTANTSEEVQVPHFNMPFCTNLVKGINSGPGFFTEEFSQKDKKKYFTKLFTQKPWSELSDEQKKETLSSPGGYTRSVAVSKHTSIFIINHNGKKFTDADNDILRRFAKVFEQTYTRFLDLQKAEAQAREAQIEAALERVRSRSMGMQKSEELKEVIRVVFDQFIHLNIKVDHAGFVVDYTPKGDWHFWIADKNEIPSKITHPWFDSIWANQFDEAKEKGINFFATHLSFEEKNKFYQDLFSYIPGLSEESREFYFSCPGLVASNVLMENVALYIENFSATPYTEEENKILMRFGKVFQQTYTRFLDLQKAEAQAREAQIEAALERVRSRTMGMHNSKELLDAAALLYNELFKLGIPTLTSGYVLMDEEEKFGWNYVINPADGTILPRPAGIPHTETEVMRSITSSWKKQESFYVRELDPQATIDHHKYLAENSIDFPVSAEELLSVTPERLVFYTFNFKQGYLLITGGHLLSADQVEMMIRFTKVFEMTYRRFLDLKKAEAQAREAQVEAALERVRSRTMGMQRSDELKEAAMLLFQQVLNLGVPAFGCGFNIWDEDRKFATAWMAGKDRFQPPFKTSSSEDVFLRIYEAAQRGESLFVEEQKDEVFKKHYEYMNSIPVFKEIADKMAKEGQSFPTFQIVHCAFFPQGYLMFITFEPVPFAYDIFKRFAKVFEQTYTRFLDLQKAEVQAREAEIELGLERVRARTMAMQKSDELKEVVQTLSTEISKLDVIFTRTSIVIYEPDSLASTWWMSNPETNESFGVFVKFHEHAPYQAHLNAWRERKKAWQYILEGNDKKQWDRYLFHDTDLSHLPEHVKDDMQRKEKVCLSCSFSNFGYLVLESPESISTDQFDILYRFAKVFDLTYTRFLDIQKAEAQAREAQIEASLERIRSRTMGMQKTDELKEIVALLYEESNKFGFESVLMILNTRREEDDGFNWWFSANEQTVLPQSYFIPDLDEPVLRDIKSIWESGKPDGYIQMGGDLKREHDRRLFTETGLRELPEHLKEMMRSYESVFISIANMKNGFIEVAANEFISGDRANILQRYAKVFEQTYTRFLDLQKAEAQAREAQIEAALERVRSRSIAMRKSEEIAEIAAKIFSELRQLDLALNRVLIWTFNDNEKYSTWWSANPEVESTAESYRIDYNDNPVFINYLQAWQKREPVHLYFLAGETKDNWSDFLFEHTELSRLPEAVRKSMRDEGDLFTISVISDYGLMMTGSLEPLQEASIDIIQRFGRVFQQSYTRYLDVQKAEAQAREAQIEAALERLRNRTLAMQKSDELAETAAVLFQQLIHLGIEPNRLYIGIIKEHSTEVEFWITDEDGSKITSAFTTDLNNNYSFKKMYDGWTEQKQSLVIDMHGKELEDYFAHLTNKMHVPFKGGLAQKRRLQYIAYYSKGFIGMASPDEQPAETMQLLERFAGAFNLTFIRFNDLKIAEAHALKAEQDLIEIKAARKNAELALAELQATQKQLVQSEKMASLGELTAGIAHEIQNPLNFVNNFSDISSELIDEMKAELEKGNKEDVLAIAEDIKQNLEKILHHGKRADGIVKGMLQHSRTSSGQKEPTDINALASEYLNLAYHGMRAKDKSFNAKFESHLDSDIEKIDVVPQEIGRVLLNLINNAFYAVSERQKVQGKEFEPTVTVSTKKVSDKISISIKDNGNGIPESIKEKIFQPFFTTKPTGLGTGLGLSLSYDIVKAHGGEIIVMSKEGQGSEFKLKLPVN